MLAFQPNYRVCGHRLTTIRKSRWSYSKESEMHTIERNILQDFELSYGVKKTPPSIRLIDEISTRKKANNGFVPYPNNRTTALSQYGSSLSTSDLIMNVRYTLTYQLVSRHMEVMQVRLPFTHERDYLTKSVSCVRHSFCRPLILCFSGPGVHPI